MPRNHRHVVQDIRLADGAGPLGFSGDTVSTSCYHHQAIDRLGDGMTVVARADDGTVEAVVVDAPAWMVGIQWHPEDTFADDPAQLELLGRFIEESAGH